MQVFPRNLANDVWAAGCGMRDDELEFVAGEREGKNLHTSFPVRKRSVFDVKCDGVIRFIDGICAKVAIASLDRSFVLVRPAPPAALWPPKVGRIEASVNKP